MTRFRTASVVAAAFTGLWVSTPARASLIFNSQLHTSGNAMVAATSFTWLCNQPGDPVCVAPPAGRGDFAVAGSTGSFAQYNGTFGLVTSINNIAQPLNTAISLPNFITFNLNSSITIELTFIPRGTNTPSTTCAGLEHCTPQNDLLITPDNPLGLFAFNLDHDATGTTAAFVILGIVHEDGGATGNLTGAYTARFNGLTNAQALQLMYSGQAQTFEGNLGLTDAAAVPEPGVIFLTGFGLLALGILSRRQR